MTGQWKPGGEDAPAHVNRMLTKTRSGAGSARTVAIAAAVVVLVLIVTIVIAVANSGSGDEGARPGPQDSSGAASGPAPDGSSAEQEPPPTTFPAEGSYRVQVLHSGYCWGVDEQAGQDRHALMQMACTGTKPKMTLEQLPEKGVYRVKLHYPEDDWIACLTLDGDEPGFLYGPKPCEEKLLHDFVLEPVADDVYRIKSPSGLCMDAWEGLAAAKTLFAAAECSPSAASQQFRFEKL
ncbi:hypothetical protein AB0I28_16585 [Phytomonospora sp. NPDC050363]|uniref:hypothetical protein n=1 Tax=Phytomonospora sp. NPDC050363 TaxID=3155642 RepID=UPI0033CE789C